MPATTEAEAAVPLIVVGVQSTPPADTPTPVTVSSGFTRPSAVGPWPAAFIREQESALGSWAYSFLKFCDMEVRGIVVVV
jgi:hypothetical protein